MRAKIRALLIVENNPYPQDFRVRREAHALRDAGYRVSVVAPRGPDQAWAATLDGIDVYRFPRPRGGDGVLGYALEFGYATLAILLLTLWIALRKGVDVIHVANPPDTLFVVGVACKLFGKRFVFDQHDLAPEIYLSRFAQPNENVIYRILRLLERCSYELADVVIVTNNSYRKIALERGRKIPHKVFVVRNGPPHSYQLLEPDPGMVRRAAHLIGYVGTIGPQDGLDYWMRSIREMVFTLGRRDFLAVIVGDGDALSDVKALAKRLDIESHVLFTGRLSEFDARKHLSAASVCVQPDPSSPLNDHSTMNKLMEYMALGRPTVAFDLTETRFTAQDAAIYVRPNDVVEFAKQVVWLLDNPDERRRLGTAGRERIASVLAWEYSITELLRAYSEGLGLHSHQPQLHQPVSDRCIR